MVKINWVRTSIACRTVPLRPKPQSVSKKAAPSVPPLGPPLLPKSTTRQGTCATSATRCPIAQPICKTERPPPAQTTQDHFAACHFAKPNPIPLAQAERVAPPLSCPPPVASAASTIAKSAGPRARLARSKKVAASTRRERENGVAIVWSGRPLHRKPTTRKAFSTGSRKTFRHPPVTHLSDSSRHWALFVDTKDASRRYENALLGSQPGEFYVVNAFGQHKIKVITAPIAREDRVAISAKG